MARKIKNAEDWHLFTMKDGDGTAVVVPNGKRSSYIWVGRDANTTLSRSTMTFTGRKTLRAFARAILEATGGDHDAD